MRRSLLFLLVGSLVVACKSSGPGPDPGSFLTVDVDGVAREYRLFVPAAPPEGTMSLLVAVHGGSGRADNYPQESQFEQLAEDEGLIIAYPLSELLPGNEGEWQLNTGSESRQDLDFIEAMIDDISAQHPVAPERVYATGYSLGSMFTYELACHLSSRFAAIASHAGSMPVSPNSCSPQEGVALMHLHGVQDGIIPYAENWDWKEWDTVGTMRSVPNLVEFWAGHYNCQDSSETAAASSAHVVHASCDQGVRIEHHRLEDVGHEWPERVEGVSTHELIWSFLQGFPSSPE